MARTRAVACHPARSGVSGEVLNTAIVISGVGESARLGPRQSHSGILHAPPCRSRGRALRLGGTFGRIGSRRPPSYLPAQAYSAACSPVAGHWPRRQQPWFVDPMDAFTPRRATACSRLLTSRIAAATPPPVQPLWYWRCRLFRPTRSRDLHRASAPASITLAFPVARRSSFR